MRVTARENELYDHHEYFYAVDLDSTTVRLRNIKGFQVQRDQRESRQKLTNSCLVCRFDAILKVEVSIGPAVVLLPCKGWFVLHTRTCMNSKLRQIVVVSRHMKHEQRMNYSDHATPCGSTPT